MGTVKGAKVIDSGGDNEGLPPLRLKNGQFMMRRDVLNESRKHFIKWYATQGENWIAGAVELLKERVGAYPKDVRVRNLGFRWGSCGRNGTVNFHWRLMLLPPDMVRYLILHELVHLHEHNHSPKFYEHLSRAVPDYAQKELWLRENGDRYSL